MTGWLIPNNLVRGLENTGAEDGMIGTNEVDVSWWTSASLEKPSGLRCGVYIKGHY